jgi:hypothetical protein
MDFLNKKKINELEQKINELTKSLYHGNKENLQLFKKQETIINDNMFIDVYDNFYFGTPQLSTKHQVPVKKILKKLLEVLGVKLEYKSKQDSTVVIRSI